MTRRNLTLFARLAARSLKRQPINIKIVLRLQVRGHSNKGWGEYSDVVTATNGYIGQCVTDYMNGISTDLTIYLLDIIDCIKYIV